MGIGNWQRYGGHQTSSIGKHLTRSVALTNTVDASNPIVTCFTFNLEKQPLLFIGFMIDLLIDDLAGSRVDDHIAPPASCTGFGF